MKYFVDCTCMVVLVCVFEWRTIDTTHHIPTPRTRHYLFDMDAVLLGFEEELTAAVQAVTRLHQTRTDSEVNLHLFLCPHARAHTHTHTHIHIYIHARIQQYTDRLSIYKNMHHNVRGP